MVRTTRKAPRTSTTDVVIHGGWGGFEIEPDVFEEYLRRGGSLRKDMYQTKQKKLIQKEKELIHKYKDEYEKELLPLEKQLDKLKKKDPVYADVKDKIRALENKYESNTYVDTYAPMKMYEYALRIDPIFAQIIKEKEIPGLAGLYTVPVPTPLAPFIEISDYDGNESISYDAERYRDHLKQRLGKVTSMEKLKTFINDM
jgi:hypothetical protein